MKKELLKIKARIKFFLSEEGGRKTDIFSLYRTSMLIGNVQTIGQLEISKGQVLELGKEYNLEIKLLNIENLENSLKLGDGILIKEGNHTVAKGNIIGVE